MTKRQKTAEKSVGQEVLRRQKQLDEASKYILGNKNSDTSSSPSERAEKAARIINRLAPLICIPGRSRA